MLRCQRVPYCFGITLTLTSGTSPKFSVWRHLGVANCHTLFIDCCDLDLWSHLMKRYCLLGHFCHIVTRFMFCLIINYQRVQFKGKFPQNALRRDCNGKEWNEYGVITLRGSGRSISYRWDNPFFTLKKTLNCIKPISTLFFSFNAVPIHGKQIILFPKLQACTL